MLHKGDRVEWTWRTDAKDGVVQEVFNGTAIVKFRGKEGFFWLATSMLSKITDIPEVPDGSSPKSLPSSGH